MTTTKKKAPTKRKTSKASKATGSKASKRKATPAKAKSAGSKPVREIDVKSLSPAETQKRVKKIYALERARDKARAICDAAKRSLKSAKASLKDAEEALDKEIHQQRFGPGPLFNPKGDGPADEKKRPLSPDPKKPASAPAKPTLVK